MILTQGESWSDMRVTEAFKKDIEFVNEEGEDYTRNTFLNHKSDETDFRLIKPKVSVALLPPENMIKKIADTIRI